MAVFTAILLPSLVPSQLGTAGPGALAFAGNVVPRVSYQQGVSDGGAVGTPPVFQNISPSPSFAIPSNAPIMFDIVGTGVNTISLVVPIITVNGTVAGEKVYDWSSTAIAPGGAAPGTATNQGPGVFDPAYAKNSSVVAITGGYRFSIRRLNGWATPPSLRAWAVDNKGNITVL